MAIAFFVFCGVVTLMISVIVIRDAYREIRALRQWQMRLPQREAATDGK